MKNKEDYFESEISDIRVGYECEILPINKEYDWQKAKLHYESGYNAKDPKSLYNLNPFWWTWRNPESKSYTYRIKIILGSISNIRVPYLTKEQIVAEGWAQLTDTCFKKNKIHLDFSYKDGIEVHLGEGTYLFQGDCKDINTFRYIIKLLNI